MLLFLAMAPLGLFAMEGDASKANDAKAVVAGSNMYRSQSLDGISRLDDSVSGSHDFAKVPEYANLVSVNIGSLSKLHIAPYEALSGLGAKMVGDKAVFACEVFESGADISAFATQLANAAPSRICIENEELRDHLAAQKGYHIVFDKDNIAYVHVDHTDNFIHLVREFQKARTLKEGRGDEETSGERKAKTLYFGVKLESIRAGGLELEDIQTLGDHVSEWQEQEMAVLSCDPTILVDNNGKKIFNVTLLWDSLNEIRRQKLAARSAGADEETEESKIGEGEPEVVANGEPKQPKVKIQKMGYSLRHMLATGLVSSTCTIGAIWFWTWLKNRYY